MNTLKEIINILTFISRAVLLVHNENITILDALSANPDVKDAIIKYRASMRALVNDLELSQEDGSGHGENEG